MINKSQLEAVDPELRRFAGRMPRLVFNASNLRFWRLLDHFQALRKAPRRVSVENIAIPREGDGSPLRLRLYRAPAGTRCRRGAALDARRWIYHRKTRAG